MTYFGPKIVAMLRKFIAVDTSVLIKKINFKSKIIKTIDTYRPTNLT